MKIVLYFTVSFILLSQNNFINKQRRYPRFRLAEKEKTDIVKRVFLEKNLNLKKIRIFIRVFKKEDRLELWAYSSEIKKYLLLKNYIICSKSGKAGPKRQQGDLQVPEGLYYIDRFNPHSNFYLSLGINYPNKSDKILGKKNNLGGDIFIHGSCVTIGCIPIEDEGIKELYLIAVLAKNSGQKRIPVYIFPFKFNDGNSLEGLHRKFWENLKTIDQDFENSRKLNPYYIDKYGKYNFK